MSPGWTERTPGDWRSSSTAPAGTSAATPLMMDRSRVTLPPKRQMSRSSSRTDEPVEVTMTLTAWPIVRRLALVMLPPTVSITIAAMTAATIR